MRASLFAVLIALSVLSQAAAAESYSIRLEFNTNLRASYGLQSGIVETVPAGTVLQVIGEFHRWLKINRDENEVWMAGWVSHSRVESSTDRRISAQSASNIDNCCFLDRQCNSDEEWTNGYWAFQDNQCAAPSTSQTQSSSQTTTTVPSQIDNCCFVDRQCNSNQEWTDGYWAFQNNQCSAPSQLQTSEQVGNCCNAGWQCENDADWAAGYHANQSNQCVHLAVHFEGSPGIVAQYRSAFDLLKAEAPQWYWYAVSGLDIIRQDLSRDSVGVLLRERTLLTHYDDAPPHIVWLARQLVHEACHVHKSEAGIWYNEGWRNELPCHEVDIQALRRVDHDSFYIEYILNIIDNYRKYRTWWGPGEWPG